MSFAFCHPYLLSHSRLPAVTAGRDSCSMWATGIPPPPPPPPPPHVYHRLPSLSSLSFSYLFLPLPPSLSPWESISLSGYCEYISRCISLWCSVSVCVVNGIFVCMCMCERQCTPVCLSLTLNYSVQIHIKHSDYFVPSRSMCTHSCANVLSLNSDTAHQPNGPRVCVCVCMCVWTPMLLLTLPENKCKHTCPPGTHRHQQAVLRVINASSECQHYTPSHHLLNGAFMFWVHLITEAECT